MTDFHNWCSVEDTDVNGHEMTVFTSNAPSLHRGIAAVKAALPAHYSATARIAHMMQRLGKDKTAEYVREQMPTTRKSRSGDLCEIFAVAYLEEDTIFEETIRKLRWSDHREQAMRGDDIIAVANDPGNKGRLLFLKGEAKSRASLVTQAVEDARKALKSHNGRPSPHSLRFFADRLSEEGRTEISDMVVDAILKLGIATKQMTHLVFTFSGNDPTEKLSEDLEAYTGNIDQWSVGVRVTGHQAFIAEVYEGVDLDGIA